MKNLSHFLFTCFLYSYLIDNSLPFFEETVQQKSTNNEDKTGKQNDNHMYFTSFTKQSLVDTKKLHEARRILPQDTASSDHSSTQEKEDPKKEFIEGRWLHKQFEAINSSLPTGDTVNMLAIRPWGVPCKDPYTQDMVTGTCTLQRECDPGLRIYRGDRFCHESTFVCCAILDAAYDLNQPFDASLGGSSFETISEERRDRKKKVDKVKVKTNKKEKRLQERMARKLAMKDLIHRIVEEIRHIINRALDNGTKMKIKKTKQLKLFLLELKKQYKKERQAVSDTHTVHSITIDKELRNQLYQLKDISHHFMSNASFRDVILSGAQTMTKETAAMLMEAYPQLTPYIVKRRNNDNIDQISYDVEYGLTYF